MSKRKRKRSLSQVMFWLMSVMVAASMVLSVVLVAILPGPSAPTPTPLPTWTPRPTATPTQLPIPTTEPPTPTEEAIGPSLPTATATVSPTLTMTPTATATPSPTPEALVFAVAGDSRNDPATYRRVLDAVAADAVEFLVHTGDLVNEGTEEQWQIHDGAMVDFSLPFYPVPGNHDGLGGELDGYLAHTGVPGPHYSFDYGPAHLAMADSHQGGISAAERRWLRQDLAVTDRPVKIVVLHHPPFDPDGTDHIMAYGNGSFVDLMVEMDVDAVFAGHIHAYAQGERDGVRYYITGGAGAPLYGGDHPNAFHHYLRVTVRGEELTVEVVEI